MSRSEYVEKATLNMNHKVPEHDRKQRLMAESQLVKKESMGVDTEFSAIENDPEA